MSSPILNALLSLPRNLVALPLLPLSFITYLLSPRFRPDQTWTAIQAIRVRGARAFIHFLSVLQVRTPLPLDAGAEGDKWVRIHFKDEWNAYFKGPLLSQNVRAGDVGGTWYEAKTSTTNSPATLKKPLTILHLHGGAFVVGDGRAKATAFLAQTLLRSFPTGSRLLAPQYRLSTLSPASNPFPAALQDALTCYLYLVHDLQISPSEIIISGDSAGANLVIAFLRYFSEFGTDLAINGPAAALAWSPWVNPSDEDTESFARHANFSSDIIPTSFLSWGCAAYTSSSPSNQEAKANPYINAKLSPFPCKTPIWVSVGGREILCDDGTAWAHRMKSVDGNRVELDVDPTAPHDILLLGETLAFEGAAREQSARAATWVGDVLGGA